MPRGQKECPKCSFAVGPRTKICPKCNHIYIQDSSDEDDENLPSEKRTCVICNRLYEADSYDRDAYGEIIESHYKYNEYCSGACKFEGFEVKSELLNECFNLLKDNSEFQSLLKKNPLYYKFYTEVSEENKNSHSPKYPRITFPYGKPRKILISKEDFDDAGIKMPIKKSDIKMIEPEQEKSKDLFEIFNEFISEEETEEPEEKESSNPILEMFLNKTTQPKIQETSFIKSDSEQKTMPGRGQKKCHNCSAIIGVRSIACKFCGKSLK